MQTDVFVTGGTGYMGQRLIPALLARDHRVRALVRPASVERLPKGVVPVIGDALDSGSFVGSLRAGDTIVHLVGTPHPSPSKAAEFERVDLASIRVSVDAARRAAVAHIVYVSVAQPAPVMRAYVAARAAGEAAIASAEIPATILRPWYVVGPGHRWALALIPFYGLARLFPATRDGARRLGLVTIDQMIAALIGAVENPPNSGIRIVDVPAIRLSSRYTPAR